MLSATWYVTDPRGHDTRHTFNQLDQIVRTVRARSPTARRSYAREYYDANNNRRWTSTRTIAARHNPG
jgi:hypothetical protein